MSSFSGQETAVGVAISDGARDLLEVDSRLIDYVEVPFERLLHSPELLDVLELPVILHCASLSVAGNLPPDPALVAKLHSWIKRTYALGRRAPGFHIDGRHLA